MRILIADDAPFIQEIFKSILEKEGHFVVGLARTGNEAFEMAISLEPDLILMDLIMPEMSGLVAAKKILDEKPLAKIIAVSTADQEDMIFQAIDCGCRGFLAKPFKKEDLLKMIHREQEVLKHG